MTFWVQHGYGKGTKLHDLMQSGALGGVVLSPADEDRAALTATAHALTDDSIPYVVDPQTYVWTIADGVARNHGDHNIAFPGLHWSASTADVERIVAQVLELNRHLATERVISPTCLQRSLSDVWTPLAIQLARETLQASDKEVLVSIVIEESALDEWVGVEDWLDLITSLDATGFYIIVARASQSYPQAWESGRYGNLMRLIYRLASVNQYEVLVGYTDVDGLGALAAGASGIASGWYYSLRAFSTSKWQPSTGGRAARPRVLVPELMVPLFAEGEAGPLARSTLSSNALPDPALRSRLVSPATQWSLNDAWTQHLAGLQTLTSDLELNSTVAGRAAWLLARLRSSWQLLQDMETAGIVVAPTYATIVTNLGQGIRYFVETEGVSMP